MLKNEVKKIVHVCQQVYHLYQFVYFALNQNLMKIN